MVLIVEKEEWGGQITITSEVVNYPGIGKTSGKELTEGMRKQAEAFGAEFKLAEVTDVELEGDVKKVITSAGTYECFGVIIATGVFVWASKSSCIRGVHARTVEHSSSTACSWAFSLRQVRAVIGRYFR